MEAQELITCNDCDILWINSCPICKDKVPYKITEVKNIEAPKPIRAKLPIRKQPSETNPKVRLEKQIGDGDIPIQTTPITIDNFFIASKGTFKELQSIPSGFTKFFTSKKSIYYSNEEKTELVRVSDHWGYRIRFCAWHLEGYKKISSWDWKKKIGNEMRIGIILYSDLEVNSFNKTYTMHSMGSTLP